MKIVISRTYAAGQPGDKGIINASFGHLCSSFFPYSSHLLMPTTMAWCIRFFSEKCFSSVSSQVQTEFLTQILLSAIACGYIFVRFQARECFECIFYNLRKLIKKNFNYSRLSSFPDFCCCFIYWNRQFQICSYTFINTGANYSNSDNNT